MGFKGLSCLQAIAADGKVDCIAMVVGAKDELIQNDYYNTIADLCKSINIPFADRKENNTIKADLAIAVSWRWIIKLSPEMPLIVFHDSLLPKYRGFAPLVNSLVNGEKIIGVTALFASEEYDNGDIIMQSSVDITYPIKIESAINKISVCYTEIMLRLINILIEDKELVAHSQDEENASYSLWLGENDYSIKWLQSAETIKRFIDSVGFPYNGASTIVNGSKLRIVEAEVWADVQIENRTPGKVIFLKDNFPVIVCGEGLLKILKIENEKGQSMLPLKNFRTQFL